MGVTVKHFSDANNLNKFIGSLVYLQFSNSQEADALKLLLQKNAQNKVNDIEIIKQTKSLLSMHLQKALREVPKYQTYAQKINCPTIAMLEDKNELLSDWKNRLNRLNKYYSKLSIIPAALLVLTFSLATAFATIVISFMLHPLPLAICAGIGVLLTASGISAFILQKFNNLMNSLIQSYTDYYTSNINELEQAISLDQQATNKYQTALIIENYQCIIDHAKAQISEFDRDLQELAQQQTHNNIDANKGPGRYSIYYKPPVQTHLDDLGYYTSSQLS